MQQRLGRIMVAVALLAAVPACTVNPVTGEQQLDLLGEAQEIEMGARLYPQYTAQSLGEVSEPELQGLVERVGQSLAEVGHRPQIPWSFNAVNDPIVNAYALPGGKISVTRGLLARMGSEDELAGVLGHEAGHVTARHAAAQYSRQMLAQLGMMGAAVYMEVEDVENRELYMLGGMFGAQLALAHYSREQERQSDELGLEYMVDAGYKPHGIIDLMETLNSQHRRQPNLLERMFSTHPMTSERIATAEKRVAALPAEIRDRPYSKDRFLQASRRVRDSREAYDRLAEAQAALGNDDPREARRLLRDPVDRWQHDGLLRAHLALALHASDETDGALREARLAARDARDIFVVQYFTGQIFGREEQWPLALEAFNRADEILPDVPQVVFFRGLTLEELGRTADAREAYRRVQQLAPNSEVAQRAQARLAQLG